MTASTHQSGIVPVDDSPLVTQRVPTILHHDTNGDGEFERITADFDGDGNDDLVVCPDTCVGVLNFGGDPKPGFHPIIEAYDAGQNGEPPLNVTVVAALEPCGTKASLAVWPRFITRAVAMVGLFKVWSKERAIRVLIKQAHVQHVQHRPWGQKV